MKGVTSTCLPVQTLYLGKSCFRSLLGQNVLSQSRLGIIWLSISLEVMQGMGILYMLHLDLHHEKVPSEDAHIGCS